MNAIQKQEKRTGLDDACLQIAQLLSKNDEHHMFTINNLVKKSGLNRQTVEKCVKLLAQLEEVYFRSYEFRIDRADNKTLIFSDFRTPFSQLPKEIQQQVLEKEYPGIKL
jgi:response regulator of citrate/malate metabolism